MKNRKLLAIGFVLTAIITGSALSGCGANGETASAAKEETEVTVLHAVSGGGPAPYISQDEDGNLVGYDIAVFEEVFERLPQYEIEWTIASDGLTGLLSGQYDISAGNWAYREERAESYYYSYPYKLTDKVFIQRSDDEPLVSLDDAAQRGYSIEIGATGPVTTAIEEYNEAHPNQPIEIVYSEAELIVRYQHVVDGVVDFTMDDGPMFNAYNAEFGFTDLVGNSISDDALSEILPSVYTYYLVKMDEDGKEIRDDINAVLKELKEDGTLSALSLEYFGVDVTPPEDQYETPLN